MLTFYHAPDLSAGSFRSTALVHALATRVAPDVEIEVITTQPNRYKTFSVQVPECERHGNVTIRRVPVGAHRSGIADQSRAFLRYAMEALRATAGEHYALVVATSSRLMTAVLASVIARRSGAPLYLDIRDIFLENVTAVLPRVASITLRPILSVAERFAFSRAARLNLVSRGFAPYFERRYPRQRWTYHPNGVDDEFLDLPVSPAPPGDRVLRVLYAGNIGEGQGLHEILPELARRFHGRLAFRVIGDGGRTLELKRKLDSLGSHGVEVIPPVARADLLHEYAAADVLFLHLNAYEAFKRLLPSKLFEYAATGKPIWAGLSGYSAAFVREHIRNAAVFEPRDADGAERVFHELDLRPTPRPEFVRQFSRRAIMATMASEILDLLPRSS